MLRYKQRTRYYLPVLPNKWTQERATAEIFIPQRTDPHTYIYLHPYTRIDTDKVQRRGGALRRYIRAAITRRKIQIRYSIIARRLRARARPWRGRVLVHGAIKERRDNVNDENRDVRAIRDERRFYNPPSLPLTTCAVYTYARARARTCSSTFYQPPLVLMQSLNLDLHSTTGVVHVCEGGRWGAEEISPNRPNGLVIPRSR